MLTLNALARSLCRSSRNRDKKEGSVRREQLALTVREAFRLATGPAGGAGAGAAPVGESEVVLLGGGAGAPEAGVPAPLPVGEVVEEEGGGGRARPAGGDGGSFSVVLKWMGPVGKEGVHRGEGRELC